MTTIANPMYDSVRSHFLQIDEKQFEGDEEMLYIIQRLSEAASDPNIRMDMNVEDEYYSIIEKRDTELMISAQKLANTKAQLAQNEVLLAQKDEVIRNSILALVQTGMSDEAIAASLKIETNTVKQIKEMKL